MAVPQAKHSPPPRPSPGTEPREGEQDSLPRRSRAGWGGGRTIATTKRHGAMEHARLPPLRKQNPPALAPADSARSRHPDHHRLTLRRHRIDLRHPERMRGLESTRRAQYGRVGEFVPYDLHGHRQSGPGEAARYGRSGLLREIE